MKFDADVAPEITKSEEHSVHKFTVVLLLFQRKFWTTATKDNHPALSKAVTLATNWSSGIRVCICGTWNTPTLIANDNPGKAVMMCSKHSLSVYNALTNCFIKPNLMWRGGKMILSLFTIGSCMIFYMPASRVSRIG